MQLSDAVVPGVRCAGFRCQVSGSRCQVLGSMCHAQGIKDQIVRDHMYDFRDLVPRGSVENLHIKNILRLNGNYELRNTFFTTLIFSLARFKREKKTFQVLRQWYQKKEDISTDAAIQTWHLKYLSLKKITKLLKNSDKRDPFLVKLQARGDRIFVPTFA